MAKERSQASTSYFRMRLRDATDDALRWVFAIVLTFGVLELIGQAAAWWNHGVWIDGDLASFNIIADGYGNFDKGTEKWLTDGNAARHVMALHDAYVKDTVSGYETYGSRFVLSFLLDLHIGLFSLFVVPIHLAVFRFL